MELIHPNSNYPDLSVLRINNELAIVRHPSVFTSRNNASQRLFDLIVVKAVRPMTPLSGCCDGIHIFPPKKDVNNRESTVWTKNIAIFCAHTMSVIRPSEEPLSDDVMKALESMKMSIVESLA